MSQKIKTAKNNVDSVLNSAYGNEISEKVLEAFQEVEKNFRLKKWKPSELDAGHFVESIRRLLELELFGVFTPFSKPLEKFTGTVLKKYEQATGKHESFRILIPRVLWIIYSIRNKRGVGHVGLVSPNEMDASLLLRSIKWILAELIRLKSHHDISITHSLVEQITEHKTPLLWRKGDVRRILNSEIIAKNQVLILLYDEDSLSQKILQEAIEYQNSTLFKKNVLTPLHKTRFIEYQSKTGICHLTPKGLLEAEKILEKFN